VAIIDLRFISYIQSSLFAERSGLLKSYRRIPD